MINNQNTKKLLLKGGRIIDPFSRKTFIGDLLVENGSISKIADSIPSRGKDYNIIDCEGLIVTHGFCDIHVHFREPGREDKENLESGSIAAIAGGFTQVCTMPNTDPVIDSPEHIHYIASKSKNLPVEIFPIGAVSKNLEGEHLTEMMLMKKNGAIAFTDDGMPIQNPQFMSLALRYAQMIDVPILNHSEDIYLRNDGVMNASKTSSNLGLKGNNSLAEAMMVYRDLLLATSLNARLHILHVSTKESVDLIKKFKSNDGLITSEVSLHHLWFSDEDYKKKQSLIKWNPAIKSEDDREALWEALNNDRIDVIATDHAPHTIEEKSKKYIDCPSGGPLESCFGAVNKVLVKNNGMSLKSLIEKYDLAENSE